MQVTLNSNDSMYDIAEAVRELAEESGKGLIIAMDEGEGGSEYITTEHVPDKSPLATARNLIDFKKSLD